MKYVVDALEVILCIGIFLMVFTDCNGFTDYEEECLQAHNKYRSKHHAPPLKLTDELNKEAQRCAQDYATKKKIDHSCKTAGAGENLYSLQGSGAFVFPTDAVSAGEGVKGWYDEIKDYDFENPQPENPPKGVTGHFTQLVWKESTEVGCGVVTIGNYRAVVSKYKPPGNVIQNGKDRYGLFKKNVLPSGSSGSVGGGTFVGFYFRIALITITVIFTIGMRSNIQMHQL